MKSLIIRSLIVVVMLFTTQALFAQSSDLLDIAYGDTLNGEISNRQFDVEYVFTGEQDDIVIINLNRSDSADFDPYLYLTTPENEIIAQNDDFYNLDSRIIAKLPADGDYHIVATRRSERSGSGQGEYQLKLEKGSVSNLDTTIEGQVTLDEAPPTHVFIPETSGVYMIDYNHVRGAYFPGLTVSTITPDYSYEETISQLSGRGLQGGQIHLQLESNVIYILTLEQNSYDYSASTGDFALYTLMVSETE